MQNFIRGMVSVFILLLLAVTMAQGNVLRVPEDYATLSAALNNVSTLDTVLVAPGVYAGTDYDGDANSPVGVTLMGSGWPCGTILIDSDGPVSNVLFLQDVQGWRVTNFEMTWADYGVRLTNTSGCEVDHNFIHDATGDPGWGNPVTACGDITELDIHHNLMARCNAGVFIGWEGQLGVTQNVRIFNNTIVDVWGYAGPYGLDAIQFRAVTPSGSLVVNNIIRKSLGQGVEFALCDQNDTEVSYNCVIETDGPWGNVQPGPGNIYLNPVFAHLPAFPDYFYLEAGSPCIDAGHPGFPLDPDGTRSDIGAFPFSQLNTPHRQSGPQEFGLEQNYPNPFNPSTRITFHVPREGQAELAVYSVQGQLVARLLSGQLGAGAHSVTFNGSQLSAGVYFYRLKGEDYSLTRKMVVLK